MKFSSLRQQVTRVLAIVVAASLSGLLSSFPTFAQTAAPSPTGAAATKEPQIAQSREEWRAAMSRFPMPKKGCFSSTYPRIEWQEIECKAPPPTPYAPRVGPRLVGGTPFNDFSAQVPDTLSEAVGSFDSITGVTSESDYGSNSYTLQLNTNTFTHALCNQAANPNPNCQGWQQFLYSTGSGLIFIQYWLLNFGDSNCPTNWKPNGGGCYRNSPGTPVSPEPSLADLAQVTLTGQVSANTDTVILTTGNGTISGSSQESILNLSQNWAIAEFNIFGDGHESEAYFNLGSTFVVRTTVNDGTTNAPLCDMLSFTAETNNLFLAPIPCSANGGPSPAIVFTESFFGRQSEISPFINTYALHDQQHFAYRGHNGEIWDLFYCPNCSNAGWQLQNINTIIDHGLTNGPPADSPPFVATYVPPPFVDPNRNQQHFAYVAANGDVWDAFYCPACSKNWQLQKINDDGVTNGPGMTKGPPAASGPFVNVFSDQQHFAYRAANGDIWDAFYCPECSGDNKWQLQKINDDGMTAGPGMTKGPPAASGPFVNVFSDQQHFVYLDANAGIWDAFYCPDCSGDNKWQLQKINIDGVTNGPPAASAPFVNVFLGHDQQHFVYLATNGFAVTGDIWDAFYCPACSKKWQLQKINDDGVTAGPGMTNGPPAISAPFVDTYVPPPFVDPNRNQQHFAYVGANGDIWDAFYCPACSKNWQLQKINNDGVTAGPGMTKGPPAVSAPFVNTYVEHNQQHFAYLAHLGQIWDAYYCPDCSGNKWQLQQLTGD